MIRLSVKLSGRLLGQSSENGHKEDWGMENEIEQLKERIKALEAENWSLKQVNIELCKAVNSGKHRKLLSALLAEYSK